jgi:hypothetical protein
MFKANIFAPHPRGFEWIILRTSGKQIYFHFYLLMSYLRWETKDHFFSYLDDRDLSFKIWGKILDKKYQGKNVDKIFHSDSSIRKWIHRFRSDCEKRMGWKTPVCISFANII